LLTVILGFCDLIILNATHDSVLFKEVEEIKNATSRAAALTGQLLEAIPRGNPKIIECLRGVQEQQFSVGDSSDLRRKPPRSLSQEDLLGLPIPEAPDHRGE
jgi:hypothetical protein